MSALVLDLSPDGAGLEHNEKLISDEIYELTVKWRQTFRSKVRVRHSTLRKLADRTGPAIYHTGVVFVGISDIDSVVVDSILIDEVKAKVAEWEANMTGTRRDRLPPLSFNRPRTALPTGYLWYRLVKGEWLSVPTRDPNQPIDGFAVRDDESASQIELLRKAYERFDEDDRKMLRMMAHLAIADRREAS